MELFKAIKNEVFNISPSLDNYTVAIILAIIVSLIFVFKMGVKFITFNEFDFKLLHKQNQTYVRLLKNTVLFIILVALFLLIYAYFAWLIIELPSSELILNIILFLAFFLMILIILYFLFSLFFKLINFILKRKQSKYSFFHLYKLIKGKYPDIYVISIIIFYVLLTVNQMISIINSVDFNQNLDINGNLKEILFLIPSSMFPPVIFYFHAHETKGKYDYLLVNNPKKLSEYDLYLDYFINDNTSVLNSEDNLYKVIKRSEGENPIYEVYEKIKRKDNESGKQNTNAKEPTVDQIPMSAADEIRKYKSLLDDGILTQEEFDAKKKELLGL